MRTLVYSVLLALLAAGCITEENLGNTTAQPDADPAPRPDAAPAGPMPVAADAPGIYEMAIDATHVYWVENGQFDHAAAVRRMPRAGGAVETIATSEATVYALALDATHVYFTNTTDGSGEYAGSIRRVAKTGGEVVRLTDGLNPTSIAVDDGWVYYTKAYGPDGEILRLPVTGGAPQLLVADVDNPWDLAVADGVVYYSEMNRGRIMTIPGSGGAPAILAEGSWVGTLSLTVDHDNVYFGSCAVGACPVPSLWQVSRAGGAVAHLADIPHGSGVLDIAVDGDVVLSSRWLVPVGGGAPIELFAQPPGGMWAIGVAAEGGEAFVGDFNTGDVYRATY